MNIGAGRIVDQDLVRLNKSLSNDGIQNNKDFISSVQSAIKNNSTYHLMGLFSDGGVHSHSDHLYYILDYLKKTELSKIDTKNSKYDDYKLRAKLKIANEIYNTYDLSLNKKYNVEVNNKTLSRIKNSF